MKLKLNYSYGYFMRWRFNDKDKKAFRYSIVIHNNRESLTTEQKDHILDEIKKL